MAFRADLIFAWRKHRENVAEYNRTLQLYDSYEDYRRDLNPPMAFYQTLFYVRIKDSFKRLFGIKRGE